MIDKTINSTQLMIFSRTALNFGEVPDLAPKNSPFSNNLWHQMAVKWINFKLKLRI